MKSLILWLKWAVNISTKEALIFTYAYNRPEFIALQNKCFKKFLKEDFDFVVFNDARDVKDETAIQNECSKLGIQCIRIPQEIHNKPYLQRFPGEDFNHHSVRNSNVVQYSLDHYGFSHKGYLLLFDSDVFLINPFSITDFMQDCSLAGRLQVKNKNNISINYLWIGIFFHYKAGSNWNYKPEIYHIEKQNALKDFIDIITRSQKRKFAV